MPKGVTELADNAFWGFGAETIVLPSTLRVLNRESFRNCEQLENITIPEGVEIIPEQCFDGCKSLTNIVLPSTLIKIQGFAFHDCRLLESITIPEGVEIIPEMCFSRCMCLTNIILPSTIKRIDPNAFSLCDNLQSLTIPIGCNKIMICEYAFGFITQHLKRFFLPSTLSSIRCVKSLNSGDLNVYCYSPSLEGMDTLTKDWSDELRLHVLPQFLETYKAQAKAERLTDKLKICPIPDEYLYYYDN